MYIVNRLENKLDVRYYFHLAQYLKNYIFLLDIKLE